MDNRFALAAALFLVLILGADLVLRDGTGLIVAGKVLFGLLDRMAFWR